MASEANKKIQTKQWILMGGISAALFAIAIGAGAFFDNGADKKKLAAEKPKTLPLSVGVSQAERDAAESKGSADVEALRKMLNETQAANEARNRELEAKLAVLNKEKEAKAKGVPTPPAPQGPEGFTNAGSPFQQNGAAPPPPVNRAVGPLGASPNGAGSAAGASQLDSVDVVGGNSKKSTNLLNAAADGTIGAANDFGKREEQRRRDKEFNTTADDDPLSTNRAGSRGAETYIPAGTYFRAVLLNGLDAPTGGQSQQNPHPVLLQIAEDANMPNKYKAALKNCMVTANGFGDIAAERAYIRSDRLSCIDDDGGAIDVRLVGYISGEDGKTGMRGRVVEKTGRILANALYAAVGSGIGQAFKQGGVSQTTNALGGTTETVTDGFKAGFGTGVSKAFEKISDYYIKVAEKMFPVIEVNGGRVVDIVVTRGVSIERGNASGSPLR